MATRPLILPNSKPGVQRDGTNFQSVFYNKAEWCRFYNDRPKKIGGFEDLYTGLLEITRSLFPVTKFDNTFDIYCGMATEVGFFTTDISGNSSSFAFRTPIGFAGDVDNQWTFATFIQKFDTDPINPVFAPFIVAHASPSLSNAGQTTETPIYIGRASGDTAGTLTVLTADDVAETPQACSGGVTYIAPYLFSFGNNGIIRWTRPSDLHDWPLRQFLCIADSKIIYGSPTRGGGASSALFFSLTSVVRVTFSEKIENPLPDGKPFFEFSHEVVDDEITVLSNKCIVKYNNLFYWVGYNQFYIYNGAVQALPNTMNSQFFFDNINLNQLGRVWGMAVPQYKEIWWFYPSGQSVECNRVVIYNVEGQFWFDTPINRSAGIPTPFPIMASSVLERENYTVWQHETIGPNKVYEGTKIAIPSFFETSSIMLGKENPDSDVQCIIKRIEPDFVQNGEMTVTINTSAYPADPDMQSIVFPFVKTTGKIDTHQMGRIVTLIFASNAVDGDYQMGNCIVDYDFGDIRPGS